MKRTNNNTFELTQEELNDIADFIDECLHDAWDKYTDFYCMDGYSWEEGKRRMNPTMYDMMNKIHNMMNDN